MQRPDFNCLHEPYGEPFHYNIKERCLRYSEDEIRKGHADKMGITYSQMTCELFGKDMAQYTVKFSTEKGGNDEFVVSLENLRKSDRIFLIRSHKLASHLNYRCCIEDPGKDMNFSHYDPSEAECS